MDPRLLQYYNRELRHLRDVGGEFATEFPKIAGRLGLDSFECADPYVERLLEGFAFLAARVQLKVDAEFPRFTQHLLEFVYPHYLAPTPSMTVVQMQPDLTEPALAEGFEIPRDTILRSQIGKDEQTACEYRTAHEITLWPLQITEAEYLTGPSAVSNLGAPSLPGLKAAIRLRLQTTGGLTFNQLSLDRLPLFLRGAGALPAYLYEQLIANALAVVALSSGPPGTWHEVIHRGTLRRVGFEESQALLPYGARSFQGYRFLQEYFAFPERFLFVEVAGLRRACGRCEGASMDLLFLLDRRHPQLVNALDANQFALFCSPAINLFPKRSDRIHIGPYEAEYQIVPDRTRPLDYEVHSVLEVVGYGATQGDERIFQPFYGSGSGYRSRDENAYYALNRRKRVLSSKQRRRGLRSSYVGSETYLSLVDRNDAPYRADLKQLGLQLLCTNRDLPLHMPVGMGTTDFTLQVGAPVQSVRCVAGPTKPRASVAEGETAWRLISHLSLNYLSLMDQHDKEGAAALRQLLRLYGDDSEDAIRKQIEGVVSSRVRNVVRRIDAAGPIVFGRGLEISVRLDEAAFEGASAFVLGAVLERFFARYASINSFTETVIVSADRGEIMRWPVQIGQRHTI
ncbi:MAG: type secretion protein [Proteobacteria bacterium]|nr:type secretion protein [Pseudomonadota bacterium]